MGLLDRIVQLQKKTKGIITKQHSQHPGRANADMENLFHILLMTLIAYQSLAGSWQHDAFVLVSNWMFLGAGHTLIFTLKANHD